MVRYTLKKKYNARNEIYTTPQKDGCRMQAEFETQSATWLGWPSNNGTFRISQAQRTIENVVKHICKYQKVYIVTNPSTWSSAERIFKSYNNVFVTELLTNDLWLRDIAPTFLISENKKSKFMSAVSWKFNGWGKPQTIEHDKDQLVALKISNFLGIHLYNKNDFVCEGGSYSVDGQGTLITTEECLLNPNRNSKLSKNEIEDVLRKYLNVKKIIWIPYGATEDEDTDGHVDNMCVFVGVGKLMLSWPKGCGTLDCEDKDQEKRSLAAMTAIENSTDVNGKPFKVYKIPHPPVLKYTQAEINTLPKMKGSYVRKAGTRMAASHVNMIITNKIVVVPTFNCESDKEAVKIVSEIFPDRKVVGVYAREILLGGGNIHCMSQQEPCI